MVHEANLTGLGVKFDLYDVAWNRLLMAGENSLCKSF